METFNMVCDVLPKDDDDVMYVAIYPSNTEIPAGIYGTGVWGNYWYYIHNGNGLHGWFIKSIIVEGEADAFAESIFGDMKPSCIMA